MRVLFCGGKNIGYGCLEFLLETQEVVGVFTNPTDVNSNRSYQSVTKLAWAHDIPVYGSNINSKKSVKVIQTLSPDIVVVVYYDRILKKQVISIPKQGCINLHMALAEEYQGCYPTTWAILNNEKRTGITIHYIDEGIDTGDIIAQCEVPLTEEKTGESLYNER